MQLFFFAGGGRKEKDVFVLFVRSSSTCNVVNVYVEIVVRNEELNPPPLSLLHFPRHEAINI